MDVSDDEEEEPETRLSDDGEDDHEDRGNDQVQVPPDDNESPTKVYIVFAALSGTLTN